MDELPVIDQGIATTTTELMEFVESWLADHAREGPTDSPREAWARDLIARKHGHQGAISDQA